MSTPSRARTDVPPDGSQPSLGDALSEVTRDLSQLVQQEVELAKAELRRDAKRTGQVTGMFGGAGVAGFMVLLFASVALWSALTNVMDPGWAALVVTGVWAVIGTILFGVARARMRAIRGPQQAAQTVREIPTALKGQSQPRRGQEP
jgi:uncharacterized membrane protein YqjE